MLVDRRETIALLAATMSINVANLREELAQLECELRKDPRFLKVEHLRALLTLYQGDNSPRTSTAGSPSTRAAPPANGADQPTSKGARIKQEIIQLLRANGPMHRSLLLEHFRTKGLMGHERNPMANLASYLVGLGDAVRSNGKGVYEIRVPDQP
jgi:hypothetical protein